MKEIYDWVPWFKELARKIADGGEQYLADGAKRVQWHDDETIQPLLRHSDENIDPFSFFYSLASRKEHSIVRERIFPSVESVFKLESRLPVDLDDAVIFPTPPAVNTLFHYRGDGDPQLLWQLYRHAANGRESVDGSDFDRALRLRGIGTAKLTQALFLINPTEFFPVDKHTTSLGVLPYSKQPKEIGWEDYRDGISLVNDAFPGCELYEANLFAYLRSSGRLTVNANKCFQVSTQVYNDGDDYWQQFKENNWVYTGGPGNHQGWGDSDENTGRYPLNEPDTGDIILVRFRQNQGYGVGVVYRNDYRDEPDENTRMHVLWVNKEPTEISLTRLAGFSRAWDSTQQRFRQVSAYAPTFQLLDRLGASPDPGPAPEKIKHSLNRILYGPPGTSKTWNTVNHALAIIDGTPVNPDIDRTRFNDLVDRGRIRMVTFHQNYAYEDFVEGIRPRLKQDHGLEYELKKGIFKQLVEEAQLHGDDERYVLIIDEINRGNIAKIFGELITLIEDSRRIRGEDATTVTLPYSGGTFAVPGNLYIVGTMNTADRGIQLLDTALRRRFTFVEMMPEPEHEKIATDVDGVNCRKILKVMNDRITAQLDREHQIGHTYLFDVTDIQGLSDAFRNRIFPLLQEYFFDDWPKIRDVLGHNGFVTQRSTDHLFRSAEEAVDSTIYEKLSDHEQGWLDPSSYRKIYDVKGIGDDEADDA